MGDVPKGAPFDVTTRSVPGGLRVTASGELDLDTAAELVAAACEALSGGGTVTLDAAGVTFMDSSGVRALDEILREAARTGAAFSVAPELGPAVRRTLELSGMLAVLPFGPRVEGDA